MQPAPEVTSLRSLVESTAGDPALTPEERARALTNLRADIVSILGMVDTHAGGLELRIQAPAISRSSAAVIVRERADVRESLEGDGVWTPDELREAGWWSHAELDAFEQEGTFEQAVAAVERQVQEAAIGRAAEILRLPDGQFAPKGSGQVLRPGMKVTVPHRSGRGTVNGTVTKGSTGKKVRVELHDGPDAGSMIQAHASAPPAPPKPDDAAKPDTPKPDAPTPEADVAKTLEQIDAEGLNEWPKPGKLAQQILGDSADTRELHTVPVKATPGTEGGQTRAYTAERKALHDKIIAAALEGKEPPSDGKPVALFMAGGAASGKSSALKARPEVKPESAVEINPDDIKEQLPEYQALLGKDRYAASAAHEESSDIAKRLHAEAEKRGLNIIVDGTGDSKRGKFEGKLKAANDAGYQVKALYVTVPTDLAVERAVKRAQKTGRFVPVPEIRNQHQNVSAWFGDVAKLGFMADLSLWDTSAGGDPVLVGQGAEGKFDVKDKVKYGTFLSKAEERALEGAS